MDETKLTELFSGLLKQIEEKVPALVRSELVSVHKAEADAAAIKAEAEAKVKAEAEAKVKAEAEAAAAEAAATEAAKTPTAEQTAELLAKAEAELETAKERVKDLEGKSNANTERLTKSQTPDWNKEAEAILKHVPGYTSAK